MFGFENKKFGVEIEFAGAWLDQVETTMQRELQGTGIVVAREGYNHNTRSYWKIVTDSSVSERISYRDVNAIGGEIVSPVLQGGAGLAQLEKICNALNAHPDVKINIKCGLHLHLSWSNCTTRQIKNIVKRYATFEDGFDSMMPRSRRNSNWCANISRETSFLRDVADHTGSLREMSRCGGGNRYRKVNLVPLSRYGSIEFRQHSGTTDFEKIKNWVLLMSDFCDASQTAATASGSVTNIVDYRRQGSARAFAEIREIFEANGLECKPSGRNWKIYNASGALVLTVSGQEMFRFYAQGACHPTAARRTRQAGPTFTTGFAQLVESLTGNASDTWMRGIRPEVAAYVAARVTSLATGSQRAAA